MRILLGRKGPDLFIWFYIGICIPKPTPNIAINLIEWHKIIKTNILLMILPNEEYKYIWRRLETIRSGGHWACASVRVCVHACVPTRAARFWPFFSDFDETFRKVAIACEKNHVQISFMWNNIFPMHICSEVQNFVKKGSPKNFSTPLFFMWTRNHLNVLMRKKYVKNRKK